MLQRYLALLKKDVKTAWRNYFFIVVIATAIIFSLILQFAIPNNVSVKPTVFYSIDFNENSDFQTRLANLIKGSQQKNTKAIQLKSRQEVITNLKQNSNSIGMIVTEMNGTPLIEFIMQGHENKKVRNALELSLRYELEKGLVTEVPIETVYLLGDSDTGMIPAKKNFLPMFLLSESTMLGFFLIAALIFMEKDEGTIRAFGVSPGSTFEYLLSKLSLMIILGVVSALITTIIVVGTEVDYLKLLLLIIIGSLFSTSLGLIVASFFNNLSQSLVWLIIINLLFALPFASYFVPSFAPWYIKMLPSYPLLFAIREAIIPTGNITLIYSTIIYFVLLGLILFNIAVLLYRKNAWKG